MFQIFIRRPVLSTVVSLIIFLLGALSVFKIPITQFPEIVPPSVIVTAKYPGANAEICVKAVATQLERAINGVQGMQYMQTVTTNTGTTTIQVFFKVGVNPDLAAVNVQNRVNTVIDELPEEVVKLGVLVEKEVNSMLMYINIMSDDLSVDEAFVYNFADINIIKELKRIDGVGFAEIMGFKDYAMRIWLRPDKMATYGITVDDVWQAIQSQNVEAALGTIGESSNKLHQDLIYVLHYTGKFKQPRDYMDMIVKTSADGVSKLKIRDIADVEFGVQSYNIISYTDGKPSASILLKQRPESNAKEIIQAVKDKMQYLQNNVFPSGMKYNINYDVSEFLDASIHEILRTLLEAFVLVSIVVFLFLQDWRSALICLVSIPVSLVGTLFFMDILGFSINLLTLFALILAIGIVVDDAIVVVESIHAKIHLSIPVQLAASKSMGEITHAVFGITLVMVAIFVPTMFMNFSVGIFYKQFSLTLLVAIILSAINALTLVPSMCAIFLRPHVPGEKQLADFWFFRKLESGYRAFELSYAYLVKRIVRKRWLSISMILLFVFLAYWVNRSVSTTFVPGEDQGIIYANITMPPGASVERTQRVLVQLQQLISPVDEVESISTMAGYSLVSETTGPSYGMALINLKSWEKRDKSTVEIIDLLNSKLETLKDAEIQLLEPPPIPGFGNGSGFELRILDKRGEGDYKKMENVTRELVTKFTQHPSMMNVYSQFNVSFPQYLLHIDKDMAANQGVRVSDALFHLQALIGSYYGSNFIRFGQLYRVILQALPEYRNQPNDILRLSIRNKDGGMVSYSSFAHLEKIYGPEQLTRYNMYNSAMITGESRSGYSSGDLIKYAEQIMKEVLPSGFSYEWSGITREEIDSGNQFFVILGISILFVYLILSAQYESFVLPLGVLLILPIGYFGALFILWILGYSANVYTQVSIIMLMGLLGKNAILIIEFAVQHLRKGIPISVAIVEASRQRIRPILMTSFAFIFGLIPLCLSSSGASAKGNQSIGLPAFGGMFIGTLIGVLLIPGVIYLLSYRKHKHKRLS